jgi:hypothetical protein
MQFVGCSLLLQGGHSVVLSTTLNLVTMQVTDHARQLLEKHLGLSFLNAGYSGPAPRMNLQQVRRRHHQ